MRNLLAPFTSGKKPTSPIAVALAISSWYTLVATVVVSTAVGVFFIALGSDALFAIVSGVAVIVLGIPTGFISLTRVLTLAGWSPSARSGYPKSYTMAIDLASGVVQGVYYVVYSAPGLLVIAPPSDQARGSVLTAEVFIVSKRSCTSLANHTLPSRMSIPDIVRTVISLQLGRDHA